LMAESMEEEPKGLATEEGKLENDEDESSNTRGFVDFVPQVLERKRERKVLKFKELEDQAFQSISHLRKQKPKPKLKETKSAEKSKQGPAKGADGYKKFTISFLLSVAYSLNMQVEKETVEETIIWPC
jgi:hypothetical protein